MANWLLPVYCSLSTPDSHTFFGSTTTSPFLYNSQPLSFTDVSTLDQSSSYATGSPTGVKVVVRPNKYEPGRAHVIVYNWDQRSTVDIDVSSILEIGAQYEVRNSQDYTGHPVQAGTYWGGSLRLPMSGLQVAVPIGSSTAPAVTGPEFNAFVIIKR